MYDLLVASLAALCSSQLVHLCDALLEFLVLALFVRVSLVLFEDVRVRGCFVEDDRIARVCVYKFRNVGSKRTSHFQGR